MPTARVFDQFTALTEKMAKHAAVMGDARRNLKQPEWLELSESTDSRKELLEPVDRREINEEFKEAAAKAIDTTVGTATVMELQHDFIAGFARDMFATRRPRLARLLGHATVEEGYGSDFGVIRHSIRGHIDNLVKGNS